MKAVKRPGPLVEIEWLDIFTTSGWQDEADLQRLLAERPGMPCVNVGYLVAETKDRIVVCSGAYGETGNVGRSEITVIPRGCVERITRLGPTRRKA